MQITCPRKELHEAVQFVLQGVSKRTTLPILSNILLEGDDRLKIVASDLEVWVERTIPTAGADGGKTTVPGRLFSEILAGLPEGNVTLTTGDRHDIKVECGSSKYNVLGLPADEFPVVPHLEEDLTFTMPISLFKEMARQVEIAVSRDDARPALTGILFSSDGQDIRMVATDTHRLALRKAPAANVSGIGSSLNAVIPERAISMITKAPASDDDEVKVTIENARVGFEIGPVRLVASLITGAFPAYERVLPTDPTRKWTLPTEEFAAAVRRADVVAKQSSHRVVLTGNGDRLEVTARSEGFGDANETMEMVSEGGEMAIAFNAKYVLDALGVIDTDGVVLEMTEPLRAALLRPATENPEFQYVVMPMALS
jgi:DNA polymerase-3 subunit beta